MAVAEERADGVEARVGQRLEERAVAAGLGHPPSVLPTASVASFAAEPVPVTTSWTLLAAPSTTSVAAFAPSGAATSADTPACDPPADGAFGSVTVTLAPVLCDGAEEDGSVWPPEPPSWRAKPPRPSSGGARAAGLFRPPGARA